MTNRYIHTESKNKTMYCDGGGTPTSRCYFSYLCLQDSGLKMNVFYLDEDPELCAQYHADRHVIKMILETTQMLSTVLHLYSIALNTADGIYEATQQNHPCIKWAAANMNNFLWLYDLAYSLCKEYEYSPHNLHLS